MKRGIFYLLLLVGLVGATCIVLFVSQFMPYGRDINRLLDINGYDMVYGWTRSLINGDSSIWGTSASHFFVYALILFLILNLATLVTLLLILMFSRFRFQNIRRPYMIGLWYLVSALILTGFWFWMYFDIHGFNFVFRDKIFAMIPIASALVVNLVGLVFGLTDRRQY